MKGMTVLGCMYCKAPSDPSPPGWLLMHHTLHCERRECILKCEECADDIEAIGGPEGRPIYESEGDRKMQKKIIDIFRKEYGAEVTEMPPLHPYDYQLTSHDVMVGLAEVKRRMVDSNKYEHIWLSKQKVDEVMREASVLQVPFFFVVEFDDGVWWVEMKPPYPVQKGGRTDRGDEQDIEDVYCIPSKSFRSVKA